MRAIKKEDLENINFYKTPKWLFNLLLEGKITPGAYCLYMLMYDRTRLSSKNNWIDEEGEVFIIYSWDSMREDRKVKSNTQIKRDLDKLYELGLLQVKRRYRDSNLYYLNIYSGKEESEIIQNVESNSEEKVELHKMCESDYTKCVSEITQFVEANKNNFNKNNLIITTTNKDNINYKDQDTNQPEKVSSSSFEKNIKEIKSYLLENIKDIPTCKNIMFLVENIGLSLERIKEVVNYATKSQKGIGFIYKALEENWTLKDITYSTEKNMSTTPTARGHKFNSEAIDSTKKAKKAKEEYTAKIDRLQGIYQVLSDTEKKKIDNEAYQVAVEQYGVTVAKIMARTKTKFEILEKYYLLQKGA
ncbi:replication initiator protein A [Cetobacterium somerae]|uniref:replication initiator protein A n=1 Tax=Cetobacterium somerae TaxID=188913 RepID=UPI00211DB846|nr:replication initiator protein A [Cetobacterium somerae]MCQ9628414.1 replication initiator protein A [Cetobacterium somerae]